MPAEYDRIAANPLRFIVMPGHQIDEIERVVVQSETYFVVEKVGEARAEIMREHPRQRHRTD